MHQIQIPLIPISERTTFAEIHLLTEEIMHKLHDDEKDVSPLYIYIPHPEPKFPQKAPQIPETLSELIIIAIDLKTSQACRTALDAVAKIEPARIQNSTKKSVKIKPNTPMKNIFKQMNEISMTVLGFTVGEDENDQDSICTYFMTTAHTIRQFRSEIKKQSSNADPCAYPQSHLSPPGRLLPSQRPSLSNSKIKLCQIA